MANLKNITELPVVESTEGLNLIVEDSGSAKRIPADSVGKVKSVNGAQPDVNGNVKIEIPEGFSGSWNDLKDKPFYTEEAGEMTVNVEEMAELPDFPIFKVGDTVTVKVDGVEHTLVAYNGFGCPSIGGEQFGWEILVYENSVTLYSYSADSKAVSYKAEKVHPIDGKYLPFLPQKLASCAVYSYDIRKYIPISYNCPLNDTGSMPLTPAEWGELCTLVYEMPKFGLSFVVNFGGDPSDGYLDLGILIFGVGYFEGARFECIYDEASETITANCVERNVYWFPAST